MVTSDVYRECDKTHGLPAPVKYYGGQLGVLVSSWETIYKARQAAGGRALAMAETPTGPPLAEYEKILQSIQKRISYRLAKALRAHPVWPWLSQFKGMGGVHVARVVAAIGDPHRFPGRLCSEGHHLPSYHGGRCPKLGGPESVCGAEVGDVRRGTGVRSVWHYFGLHVVNGRLPRRQRGSRCDWNVSGRTALLMPDGVADAIIKHRVQPYRTKYDESKLRICEARAEPGNEIEWCAEKTRLTNPHWIARVIAVKAFLGDLLMEWKRAFPVDE